MADTIEKMKEDIERLKQELEERRKERIAKGLPPDPPKPFVPIAHAILLCERVKPLRRFVIKYAKLTHDARQLISADVSQFKKYERDLKLIWVSKGLETSLWGAGVSRCIKTIAEVTEAIKTGNTETLDPFSVARSLYLNLQLTELLPIDGKIKTRVIVRSDLGLDYKAEEKEWKETMAELERLRSDEAAFKKEIDDYWEQYESIKHLY